MTERIMQKSLFETEVRSSDKLIIEAGLENLGKNHAVSFGITKTGLNKGRYDVLENIFYGMHNLEIPLEILEIENPAEILANYFSAGELKRRDAHLNILNIPRDFFGLVNYINWNSYHNTGFAGLAHEFKKYFDNSPGKQRKRLGLLEQSVRDRFADSFFTKYRPSNREEPFNYAFYDPNCDGKSKGIYADRIYKDLKSLSEKAKKLSL